MDVAMEKKQIVYIHGGNAFSRYDAFLEYLKNADIRNPLGEIVEKKWQPTIREELMSTHSVLSGNAEQ